MDVSELLEEINCLCFCQDYRSSLILLIDLLLLPLLLGSFWTTRVITTMTVFTIANVFIIQKINKFVLDPDLFSAVFGISEENATKFTSTASGLSQTMLFSICPVIFKFVAYCEGSSNSMEMAERRAMIYFWYFYLIARFMGQILWQAAVSFLTGSKYQLVS